MCIQSVLILYPYRNLKSVCRCVSNLVETIINDAKYFMGCIWFVWISNGSTSLIFVAKIIYNIYIFCCLKRFTCLFCLPGNIIIVFQRMLELVHKGCDFAFNIRFLLQFFVCYLYLIRPQHLLAHLAILRDIKFISFSCFIYWCFCCIIMVNQ